MLAAYNDEETRAEEAAVRQEMISAAGAAAWREVDITQGEHQQQRQGPGGTEDIPLSVFLTTVELWATGAAAGAG